MITCFEFRQFMHLLIGYFELVAFKYFALKQGIETSKVCYLKIQKPSIHIHVSFYCSFKELEFVEDPFLLLK